MKKNILSFLSLFLVFVAFSQEKITVKKGVIYSQKVKIANYDGKKGEYKIKAEGSDSVLFTLYARGRVVNNPLLDDNHLHWYDVSFKTQPEITFTFRAHPTNVKVFGKEQTLYNQKYGNDIIEEFFNDSVPSLLVDGKLNKENIEKFIAQNTYPIEKELNEIKALEDSIGVYAQTTVQRDLSKPVSFVQTNTITNTTIYNIVQDGKIIGKLHKKVNNVGGTEFQVWKKAPANATLQGKPVEFIPILLSSTFGSFTQKARKIVGNEEISYKPVNMATAENELIAAAISLGLL